MRHPRALRSAARDDAGPDAGVSGVRWDLRPLYESANDPRVGADTAEAARRAAAFAERYRGRIAAAELTPTELRELLAEYEAVLMLGEELTQLGRRQLLAEYEAVLMLGARP